MADYTGNIQDDDILIIASGTTNYKVRAGTLAEYINSKEPAPSGVTTNILDTDLFLIADGTVNYKITADDLANYVNTHASQPSASTSNDPTFLRLDSRWGGYVPTGPYAKMARIYSDGTVAVTDQPTGGSNSAILTASDGFTFSQIGSPLKIEQNHPTVYAFHPDWPTGTVLAQHGSQVLRSTNHGASATVLFTRTGLLSTRPKANGEVMENEARFGGGIVNFSSDYGATWTARGNYNVPGFAEPALVAAAASEDPASDTWIGLCVKWGTNLGNVVRTTDAGLTWTDTGIQVAVASNSLDTKAAKFIPGEPGEWLAVGDGERTVVSPASYYSTDDGVTWSTVSVPSDTGLFIAGAYNRTTKMWAGYSANFGLHTSTTGPGGPWTTATWFPSRTQIPEDNVPVWRESDNQLYVGGFARVQF